MSKILEFFSKLDKIASKIMSAIKDKIENSFSIIFYICMLYFTIIAIYFTVIYFIKLIDIVNDLLFNNEYMVALDMLTDNCYSYADVIENFDTSLILPSTLNGELVKKVYNIPIQYLNTNLNKYLDLTVADFYWPCSYRSYLSGSADKGKPSIKAIKEALNKYKVRLIYLDIYGTSESFLDTDNVPVVRSETLYLNFNALDFHECLTTIFDNAWSDDNHQPLFLYLNVNFASNKFLYQKMYYAIMKVFNTRLLDKKYSFSGRGGIAPIGKIKMTDAIDKLIIISNVYPTKTKLDEIINSYNNSSYNYCSLNQYLSDYYSYGGIVNSSNASDLVDTYKTNIGIYYADNSDESTNTINNSKGKMMNPDFLDCAKYGAQMPLMSIYLPDTYLTSWYYAFKKNNNYPILKNKTLRYIAVKEYSITQQNPLLSYATTDYSMPKGLDFNIGYTASGVTL